MHNETIKVLAANVAAENKIIKFVPNSVINMLDENASDTDYNELALKIAGKIGNEVGIYKNNFLPFLKNYQEIVTRNITDRKSDSKLLDYKIKEVSIPTIIEMFIERDIIIAEGRSYDLPISSLSIAAPTAAVIRGYLTMEIMSMQDAVSELLHDVSDDDLVSIWEKYFLNVSGSNDNISSIIYRTNGDMTEVAVLFVLVHNLLNKIPEGVTVNAEVYKRVMRDLYNKLINDISVIIKRYNTHITTNKLIMAVKGTTAAVHSVVYNKFLKENTVEAIFGLLARGNVQNEHMYLADIVVNRNSYVGEWNKAIRMDTIATKMNATTVYNMAYVIGAKELLSDTPASIEDNLIYTVDGILDIVNSYTKRLLPEEVQDIEKVSLYIISKVILNSPRFYEFTNAMISYRKLDEKLTAQEAASFATLDMITSYILEQVKVD